MSDEAYIFAQAYKVHIERGQMTSYAIELAKDAVREFKSMIRNG